MIVQALTHQDFGYKDFHGNIIMKESREPLTTLYPQDPDVNLQQKHYSKAFTILQLECLCQTSQIIIHGDVVPHEPLIIPKESGLFPNSQETVSTVANDLAQDAQNNDNGEEVSMASSCSHENSQPGYG
jgi:hypothetical protein